MCFARSVMVCSTCSLQDASIIRCLCISLGQDKASEMHPQATCQTNTLSCTKRVFTKLGSCLDWVVCSPLTWLQINVCLNPKWRVHWAYWTWIVARNHFLSWSTLSVAITLCFQLAYSYRTQRYANSRADRPEAVPPCIPIGGSASARRGHIFFGFLDQSFGGPGLKDWPLSSSMWLRMRGSVWMNFRKQMKLNLQDTSVVFAFNLAAQKVIPFASFGDWFVSHVSKFKGAQQTPIRFIEGSEAVTKQRRQCFKLVYSYNSLQRYANSRADRPEAVPPAFP